MKSSFIKGDKVKTTDKAARKIQKGKLNEPLVDFGVVVGNEHYNRIVVIKCQHDNIVRTKPEFIEFC